MLATSFPILVTFFSRRSWSSFVGKTPFIFSMSLSVSMCLVLLAGKLGRVVFEVVGFLGRGESAPVFPAVVETSPLVVALAYHLDAHRVVCFYCGVCPAFETPEDVAR